MRVVTKIGDIFSVKVDEFHKRYFQYICNDLTQLNSAVIRVFVKKFPINSQPDLAEIVNENILFYAHCVLKWGVKLQQWEKVGTNKNIGTLNHILFRDSSDYGNIDIKVSENWWIWKINEDQQKIGKLTGQYREAEIGIVISPNSITHMIKFGEIDFVYPTLND